MCPYSLAFFHQKVSNYYSLKYSVNYLLIPQVESCYDYRLINHMTFRLENLLKRYNQIGEVPTILKKTKCKLGFLCKYEVFDM